jgi:TRAP-type C4-dicarboxylate transport system substrate-binding protein
VDNLKKAGAIVNELTPAQRQVFKDAVAQVYVNWEPKIGKAMLDEFKATVEKVK